MKQEYNSNISLGREIILLVPVSKTIFIKHCSICDTIGNEDAFLEWLKIIEAGTKVRISDTSPYLDLKHVTYNDLCIECTNTSITQVIFEWVSNNDSKDKA